VIFALSLAGLLCLAAMLLVWAVFINPINLRVQASTFESFPADWASLRDHWHQLRNVVRQGHFLHKAVLNDVLALQRDVARGIAREIRIKLTPQEQMNLAPARRMSSLIASSSGTLAYCLLLDGSRKDPRHSVN
jgi:hypothetical protein